MDHGFDPICAGAMHGHPQNGAGFMYGVLCRCIDGIDVMKEGLS